MKQFTRRDFVTALAAAGRSPAFLLHGVASGDPLHDRVILWIRITPARLKGAVAVQWRIARDRRLRNPVATGAVVTYARRDYTVKVDAGGLEPGRTY